jgi:hypothetical protein
MPEKKFWEDFDAAHPCILGALLDGVAHGLHKLPDIHLDRTPRMADFATWATACETAYWKPGTFARAYEQNRDDAIGTVIEADLVATAIQTFMAEPERTEWTGTATDLLGALKTAVGEEQAKLKEWPSTPRSLSGRVRRQAATLRRVGIDITLDDKSPDRKRTRLIRLARKERGSDRPQPSDRPNSQAFSGIGAVSRADGADNEAQSTVRTNILKNKASDGVDDTDANLRTHTGTSDMAPPKGPGLSPKAVRAECEMPARDHWQAGLYPNEIRALAEWYRERFEAERKTKDSEDDPGAQARCDVELRKRLLHEYGVFREHVATEFNRVMDVVFNA